MYVPWLEIKRLLNQLLIFETQVSCNTSIMTRVVKKILRRLHDLQTFLVFFQHPSSVITPMNP